MHLSGLVLLIILKFAFPEFRVMSHEPQPETAQEKPLALGQLSYCLQ